MKIEKLSVRKFLRLVICGVIITDVILLMILFLMTQSLWALGYGLLLTIVFFLWSAVVIRFFRKKLSRFTDNLCRMLDDMMDSATRPEMDYEAETLLARIGHRLERLYNIMQKGRNSI